MGKDTFGAKTEEKADRHCCTLLHNKVHASSDLNVPVWWQKQIRINKEGFLPFAQSMWKWGQRKQIQRKTIPKLLSKIKCFLFDAHVR